LGGLWQLGAIAILASCPRTFALALKQELMTRLIQFALSRMAVTLAKVAAIWAAVCQRKGLPMDDDIIEALESSAPVRKDRGRLGDPSTGDKADMILWREQISRFIDELDDNITVREIRMALEDYS